MIKDTNQQEKGEDKEEDSGERELTAEEKHKRFEEMKTTLSYESVTIETKNRNTGRRR